MSAHRGKINFANYTRDCWLAGYDLAGIIHSCRLSGASKDEITNAVSIYIAGDNAMVRKPVIQQGAHLDRRAAS